MTWIMPTEFPDLSAAKGIAVDIETRDPDLQSKGPGVRRDGYIVGIGIVTDDKEFKAYYPIAHDEGPNMNKSAVLAWLSDELGREDQPKIGANLLYDIDYLTAAGVDVKGNWLDVQNAEPLINENIRRYNLDALALKYLGKKKLSDKLIQACKDRELKGKPHSNIWRLPAAVVGPYCIEDAELSLDILECQLPILHAENIYELFRVETYLMPLLLRMRQTGVRLDTTKLEKVIKKFKAKLRKQTVELSQMVGFKVEPWTSSSLTLAFDKLGLSYPLTPKTKKPSFTRGFMENHEHPFARMVVDVRRLHKFIGTFLEGQMQSQLIGDRIHCQFNQLRGNEYGTVTGRFSSSHPNLQFIPARDEELGPLCRSMFIPEEGCSWVKADYSQIEYRIFAHYAIGTGAEDFRDTYNENPDIDYHQWCADKAGISRKNAKTINFGLLYGMGVRLLAHNLNLPIDEAKDFLQSYHAEVPFLRTTSRKAMDVANRRGYVRTILNRRRRFQTWEPSDRMLATKIIGNSDPEIIRAAVRRAIGQAGKNHNYSSGIQRQGTYKALNAIVQGSSADMIKKAMVDCWRAGIFDTLTPHLTVHDELDVSVPDTKDGAEALQEMLILMRDAIELKVPVIVDCETGPSWGEVK